MMIKEIEPDKLIEGVSKELGKINDMKPPEWAEYVKTGVCKERVPTQENWWYIRSASILRKLSLGKPIGVSRLKRVYGSNKRRGHKPNHKYPASGSVIREIFQQLEKAGLVKMEKGKGRRITAKGNTFLKDIAKKIEKN
ncbi:MAG: 30S ribosomal protein S19e [Candidatus Aenigmarchaeota archaeon]|nr:30S ribosomal protein S19e [Candidatus Aenigmarchaeota archaeon]